MGPNNMTQAEAKAGKSQSGANKVSEEKGKKKSNGHHPRQSKQNQQKQQQQQQKSPNTQDKSKANLAEGSPPSDSPQDGSLDMNGKSTQSNTNNNTAICSNLNEFSERAKELKDDINKALERQANMQIIEQPLKVTQLLDTILELSGSGKLDEANGTSHDTEKDESRSEQSTECDQNDGIKLPKGEHHLVEANRQKESCGLDTITVESNESSQLVHDESRSMSSSDRNNSNCEEISEKNAKNRPKIGNKSSGNISPSSLKINPIKDDILSNEFEPLTAKLDADTKYAALFASLQRHFTSAPDLLEPICKKLIHLSDQNDRLSSECIQYKSENQKLLVIKEKLENLSRELQKANNLIRIESLDLIKAEQGKAKEQTAKIQSTLSGVIKLFDENQQRNMNLRQENVDLQSRLKSLLEHCDNWEKSVEAALKQRDIENRLIKTELAKSNLIKNEEREKFLGEKQELLRVLSMMQEQQHRIEGQEAKLRSDLSSYASKYDECQAVISKGMSKFQTESKRMLKQLEQSRHDYVSLLSKYEVTTKKVGQLLEEKKHWSESMSKANKKIETLEKLCRALKADTVGRNDEISSKPSSDFGGNEQKSVIIDNNDNKGDKLQN